MLKLAFIYRIFYQYSSEGKNLYVIAENRDEADDKIKKFAEEKNIHFSYEPLYIENVLM